MGGGSWGDPNTHSQCMHVIWFLLYKHKRQQATQHDRLKPVSTNMVRPWKHFIYLWEEQKKYTNRSKIRLELEAFISEQRSWSLVPWKVEEETEAVLSAEDHRIFSDETVFYYTFVWTQLFCVSSWHYGKWHDSYQRSIWVSPPQPLSENDNE